MLEFTVVHPMTLALGLPGGWEWFVILIIGVLLFGKRLPDVAKGLGRSIVEFKKGIKGVEEEIDDVSASAYRPPERLPDRPAGQPAQAQAEQSVPSGVARERPDQPR